ncbi:antichymotrypsin-2-like [Venturia canescens]|uniref:antichymotrypsin-2-like n=1 Tax=Venturia canescens TaxID=32260 RepID=UPI001C9D25BF|nr:antichymotrypsin-2-like [Venturia canescens]XP_043288184.1 antichymotrypsin-2-like [Venturia canescens]
MAIPAGEEKKFVKELLKSFSSEYFQALCAQVIDTDKTIAPLSSFITGSLLAYGARGETREEYFNKIGLPEDKTESAKIGYTQLLDELAKNGIRIEPKIRLPGQIKLNSDFAKFIKTVFRAELGVRQTTSLDVVKKANEHISFHNAVTFRPIWQIPFEPSDTVKRDFYVNQNPNIKVPPARLRMMYTEGIFRADDLPSEYNASFIELPLKTEIGDDRMSIFVIRMTSDYTGESQAFVEKIRSLDLTTLLKGPEKQLGVYLPKLKINFTYSLHVDKLAMRDATGKATGEPTKNEKGPIDFNGVASPSPQIETRTNVLIKIDENSEESFEPAADYDRAFLKSRDFEVNRLFVAHVVAIKDDKPTMLMSFSFPDRDFIHHADDSDSDESWEIDEDLSSGRACMII